MSFHLLLSILVIINELYLFNTSEIVSISFDSFFKKGTQTNITSIDDLSHSNLYAKINIGEPPYEINAFLSVQHSYFSITSNRLTKNINDFLSHYDLKKSNSFKNITINGRNLIDSNYDSIAKEKFELNVLNFKNNERYNISIDDMIFIYNDDNKNEENKQNSYYLNIGFQMINQKKYKDRKDYNFIYQLKQRKIIENYDWCIFFKKGKNKNGIFLYNPDELINAKGELLIGDLPNNYNSNFHKNQLLTTYSLYNEKLFNWALEFSKIYYNNTSNKTIEIYINEVQLNINNYIILCPMTYFYKIKNDFFDYYLSKNICKSYIGTEYRTFYCEKSENFTINNLKLFPTLYMEHKELQYIFEFTYEDLFIEKDGKYWFLIAISIFNSDLEEWHMGIIFLRKYNLIFNQDSKTISFYNPNIPISNQDSGKRLNKIIFAIYFLFSVIFIIIIYVLIAKLGFLKKSSKGKNRLNHIYDNFDYMEQKSFDIHKKSKYGKNLLMEMKRLVFS